MTATRKQILAALEELSREHPAMRFGQLVAHVARLAEGPKGSAVYDVEDEQFLQAAREHLDRHDTAPAGDPAVPSVPVLHRNQRKHREHQRHREQGEFG